MILNMGLSPSCDVDKTKPGSASTTLPGELEHRLKSSTANVEAVPWCHACLTCRARLLTAFTESRLGLTGAQVDVRVSFTQ